MSIGLWIIAGLLAALFAAAGAMKVAQTTDKLAASGLAWVEDFTPGQVKAIGILEVLAAVGLIVPAALDIAPVLVPIAAVGLAALMAGAAVVHARRKEGQMIVVNVVLLLLAVIVAVGRFGPESFTS
jgi:uncharacterized membrane protein YphA (DoxX/SURF4 family)